MSYVVVPSFTVEPDKLGDFLRAARADASASLSEEGGCLQFDVVVNREKMRAEVMFYEVYVDAAAFAHHLTTPHLAAFQAALHLCSEGPVLTFERIVP